jgi:hypothetical protein
MMEQLASLRFQCYLLNPAGLYRFLQDLATFQHSSLAQRPFFLLHSAVSSLGSPALAFKNWIPVSVIAIISSPADSEIDIIKLYKDVVTTTSL